MPFEIFLIPGLLFALFGFYRGLKMINSGDAFQEEIKK